MFSPKTFLAIGAGIFALVAFKTKEAPDNLPANAGDLPVGEITKTKKKVKK